MQETAVWFLGWEDSLEKGKARLPTPVFWPGEFHGLYSPWGRKELDRTERLSLFTFIATEAGVQSSVWRAGVFLRTGVGSVLGHLGLLTGLTQKENKLHHLFMIAGSFTTWSKARIKIRLPQKLENRGAASLDVYISKEWLPGPRERYPWVVKLARCFQKDLHSKGTENLQFFEKETI